MTLRVVAGSAAAAPLGLGFGAWLWGTGLDAPTLVAATVAPAVAAVLAWVGSDLVHGSTVHIEALREQQALLAAVLGGVEESIVLRDPEGRVVYTSPHRAPDAVLDADGLVVHPGERDESWLVGQREVWLRGRAHRLTVARRLTAALDAAEVATWKPMIRALAHELNNSLTPISSLLHSVSVLVDRGAPDERIPVAVRSAKERVDRLSSFLADYMSFARLPRPRRARVEWANFVSGLEPLARFSVDGPIGGAAEFDRAQLEQVVLNLLKNAAESGSPPEAIQLSIRPAEGGWSIVVADRGEGLSDEVLERATLPFFSTRPEGTGLGLALSRDIALAHGGWLVLSRRAGGGAEARLWLP